MAKVSNTGTRIWLNQYDLSGFLNAAALNVTQETPVVTTFSDAGPRRVVGNYDHAHEHTGFFDGVNDLIDEAIHSLITFDTVEYSLGQMFGSSSEGEIVYESLVALSSKPLSGAVGGAVLLNQNYVGRNSAFRGIILRNATVTGTGNGTGRNMGASTSGQTFRVVFRVFSGTFTSIGLKLQESTDDAAADAYADIAGLADTLTVVGVSGKTTTAATEAWKRLVVSGFTGTNAVIGVTAGIQQGT